MLFHLNLTLDDKPPLVFSGVFHCIKSLFSDAVKVYVPPVIKHLKGDVCTVDHGSRGLQEKEYNSNFTLHYA